MRKDKIICQYTYEDRLFRKRSDVLADIRDFVFEELITDFPATIRTHEVRKMLIESGRRGCPTYQVTVYGYYG